MFTDYIFSKNKGICNIAEAADLRFAFRTLHALDAFIKMPVITWDNKHPIGMPEVYR